jgi:hypothetical protein
MKMTATHFNQLETMIREHLPSDPISYVEELRTLELSEKRIRWDILWDVPYSKRENWFDAVYQYLNDDHIDTALKAVFKKLGV